jgi:hypothetical protein
MLQPDYMLATYLDIFHRYLLVMSECVCVCVEWYNFSAQICRIYCISFVMVDFVTYDLFFKRMHELNFMF